MDFDNIAIGTDIEKISRFKDKTIEDSKKFLNLIYTQNEIDHCFSKKNFAQHLAARYCAKEAVVKALSDFDISQISYKDIEILNLKNGNPTLKIHNYPYIKTKVSLSHNIDTAIATVICYRDKTGRIKNEINSNNRTKLI